MALPFSRPMSIRTTSSSFRNSARISAQRTYNLYVNHRRWKTLVALRMVTVFLAFTVIFIAIPYIYLAHTPLYLNNHAKWIFLLPTLLSIIYGITSTVRHLITTRPMPIWLDAIVDVSVPITVLLSVALSLFLGGPFRMWIGYMPYSNEYYMTAGVLQLADMILLALLGSIHIALLSWTCRMRKSAGMAHAKTGYSDMYAGRAWNPNMRPLDALTSSKTGMLQTRSTKLEADDFIMKPEKAYRKASCDSMESILLPFEFEEVEPEVEKERGPLITRYRENLNFKGQSNSWIETSKC